MLCFFALAATAQTRIASDIEIRQMEEVARSASGFEARVAARINLGELRRQRNELEAAAREFEAALQAAREERDAARKDRARYGLACAWSGVALAGLERGPEAFALLEEAVRYAPDQRGAWNVYSVAMFRLGRPEKAIAAARASIVVAEGRAGDVRAQLELNFDRFALAQALIDSGGEAEENEAREVLENIGKALDGEQFQSLRRTLGKREEFETLTAPTTTGGMYLSLFNRTHTRLARLHEQAGRVEDARREFRAVLGRRTDDPMALAGLARLADNEAERERYLSQSLDANPFADDVIAEYEHLVTSGHATPVTKVGSAGSRVRLAIQKIHASDFRGAREILNELTKAHPDNDVLQDLLARAEPGGSRRPSFLDEPAGLIEEPSGPDLWSVLRLFAGNTLTADDRAALDRAQFSSSAVFSEGDAFESGTIHDVPFRFQQPARFRGIAGTSRRLRLIYRILGATTVDGRDALLLEPLRAQVDE